MNVTWESYIALVMTAGGAGLAAAADRTLDEADPNCPRDTETLVKSRTRTEPEIVNGDVVVIAGYGRTDDANPKSGEPSAAYAVAVHEEIGRNHPGGGTAKWLENAVTANANDYTAIIGTAMAEAMR